MLPAENPATLSVSINHGFSVEVRLGLRELRIGRSREADLLLPDPSISRLHARIFRVGDRYFLQDSSRNGTFVGEKKISRVPLENGQAFRMGPYTIHFRRKDGPVCPSGDPPTEVPGASDASAPPAVPRAAEPPEPPPGENFGLVGRSPSIRKLIGTLRRVGTSDLPVLIEGETGAGKELASKGIHEASVRRNRPFVVVNCGAISPHLIESELFGHEKGAFTGATAQRRGAFEIAHGGTLFLDEIGELPLPLQPKLLRVLEQKEIKRVGGNETIPVDVRIIAATNRNLRDDMAKKLFRDDLYFRIGAIALAVPPLRARPEDIPVIARHFLEDLSTSTGRPCPRLTDASLAVLLSHAWPGNVRELRNAIQRAVVMSDNQEIQADDFGFLRAAEIPPDAAPPDDPGLSRWEQAERGNILAELARHSWNKTKTARELGIAKSTLFEKLKKFGIRTPGTDQ